MQAKKILSQIVSKQMIKISIIVLVVGILFFHSAFAQNTTAAVGDNLFKGTADFLDQLIKFCSWSWVILAAIAGKFMTNDMIYGSWMHLDEYLRQIRNITKNFANFGLLAFMLYEIISFISGKGKSIQSIVTKGLIAGVLINASRFLMGAVVDISTIATSAIASFPIQFMKGTINEQELNKQINENLRKGVIVLDKNRDASIRTVGINDDQATEDIVSKIMPGSDSIAGPLVFIGASALRVQDMMNFKTDQTMELKNVVINFGLKTIVLLLYVITLLFLIIANIIRIGFLWVIIAAAPLIVLFMVFKGTDKGLGDKGIAKNLNLKTILMAVFKPTIFVAMLSVILIFVVSMQNIMTNQDTIELNGVNIRMTEGTASMGIEGLSNTTINDRIFTQIGNTTQSIFANLIIYFATMFLLRFLIKIAITSGSGPIEGTMKNLTKMTENFARTVPIFNGYGRDVTTEGEKKLLGKVGEGIGMNLDINKYNSSFGKLKNDQFENEFRKRTGEYKDIDSKEQTELYKAISIKGDDFLQTTRSFLYSAEHAPLIIGENTEREAMFGEWLEKGGKTYFKAEDPNIKNLETFKKSNNGDVFKKIHAALGGEKTKAPETYDQLKAIKYGINKK